LQPSIVAEVQTMKLLKHPNILPLYAAFLDDDQLWMVMPYVAGGSASDIMRRTSPNVGLSGVHDSTCAATPRTETRLCRD
jgi:serine/threonine protein kinase